MKVGVRLIGDGFTRAEALVADMRCRALERLQARIAVREQETRPGHEPRVVEVSATTSTRPTR